MYARILAWMEENGIWPGTLATTLTSEIFGLSLTVCFPYRGDITAMGVRRRMKENCIPFWGMVFSGVLFSICAPQKYEEKIKEIFGDCDFFFKAA